MIRNGSPPIVLKAGSRNDKVVSYTLYDRHSLKKQVLEAVIRVKERAIGGETQRNSKGYNPTKTGSTPLYFTLPQTDYF